MKVLIFCRRDTLFCSEECRLEQIEINEALSKVKELESFFFNEGFKEKATKRVHLPKQNPEELPFPYKHYRNRLSILTKQKNKDELPQYITRKRNEK